MYLSIEVMEKKAIILLSCLGLVSIVFLEFLFIEAELFQYFPNIGIGFHFFGGFFVALNAYYLFQVELLKLKWSLVTVFVVGMVGLAAVGWESFEWILSQLTGSVYQGSVENIVEDLFVGLVGGIAASIIISYRHVVVLKVLDMGMEMNESPVTSY